MEAKQNKIINDKEDEEIRKEIIEQIRWDMDIEQILSKDDGCKYIDWLERQGKKQEKPNK